MNSNEYNTLKTLYLAKKPLFFREISKLSKVSIGGTQQVMKDYARYISKKKEGRNTYYSLKKNIESLYLKITIEIKKSEAFIQKNPLLKELFKFLIDNDIPAAIFGSYARGTNAKESDLDILLLSKAKIPDHICPIDMHRIVLTKNQFERSIKNNEPLINEIKKGHIIISGFDFFVNMMEEYDE